MNKFIRLDVVRVRDYGTSSYYPILLSTASIISVMLQTDGNIVITLASGVAYVVKQSFDEIASLLS